MGHGTKSSGSRILSADANLVKDMLSGPWMAYSPVVSGLKEAFKGNGTLAGLAVTEQAAPAMGVTVGKGRCVANGTFNTKTSTTNVTITAADPTYPRKDLIVIDSAGSITAVAGTAAEVTPTGSTGPLTLDPEPPDVPANKICLAEVWVEAGETTILDADITDRRTYIRLPVAHMDDNIAGSGVAWEADKIVMRHRKDDDDGTGKILSTVRFGPYETYEWHAQVASVGANLLIHVGSLEEVASDGNHGAIFVYHSGAQYTFQTKDDAGTAETTALAGQDWTADTKFKVVWEVGSVKLYCDDTLRATHNTRVPTQAAHRIVEIVHSAAQGAMTWLKVDKAFMEGTDTPI